MKLLLMALTLLGLTTMADATDLRVASQQARTDFEAAQAEARESQARILEDKTALTEAMDGLSGRVEQLTTDIADLQRHLEELQAAEIVREEQQTEARLDMREYTGVIREAARDLETILSQSHFTVFDPERMNRLAPVLEGNRFPGMEEITTIGDLLFDEMTRGGEVDRRSGTVVDAGGKEITADILTIGPFCAAYSHDGQTGFLRYHPDNRQFFTLSKAPPLAMRRSLGRYMRGDAEAVYFDFSRGAALRQLSHRATLMDNIKNGGPIVWPILAVGLLALLIGLERILFLNRVHANTDRLMGRVNELAGQGDWRGCETVLQHDKGKPVNNVLRAGLSAVNESRETLESVLQEAILKELPRLERFLPALNIMGAVAPLLGPVGHGDRHDRNLPGHHPLWGRRSQNDVRRHFRSPGDDHAGAGRGHPDHAHAHFSAPAPGAYRGRHGGKGCGPVQYHLPRMHPGTAHIEPAGRIGNHAPTGEGLTPWIICSTHTTISGRAAASCSCSLSPPCGCGAWYLNDCCVSGACSEKM